MCYLLGINSLKKRNYKKIIEKFLKLEPHNNLKNDGFGIAIINNEDLIIEKDFNPYLCENINLNFNLKNGIIHYREACVGNVSIENNHPFFRLLKNNKLFIFAHNGNVTNFINSDNVDLSVYQPDGQTDSEISMCHFLNKLNVFDNFFDCFYSHCVEMSRYGTYNVIAYYDSKMFVFNSVENHLQLKLFKKSNEVIVSNDCFF